MLEHIPLIMGLISFAGGVATWYGAAVKKSYASERDFNHLKRNYESLSANISALVELTDDRFDRLDEKLLEMKLRQEMLQKAYREDE